MELVITGKILETLELQTGTGKDGKTWSRQAFIIETIEQYPKKVCFQVWNERVDALKRFQHGEAINATFRAESREFNGRWYTDLTVYKLESAAANAQPQQQSYSTSTQTQTNTYTAPQNQAEPVVFDTTPKDDDDLPF